MCVCPPGVYTIGISEVDEREKSDEGVSQVSQSIDQSVLSLLIDQSMVTPSPSNIDSRVFLRFFYPILELTYQLYNLGRDLHYLTWSYLVA